jgi:hypothetical protein
MALELYSHGPLPGGVESPFTCSNCKRVALWKKFEEEPNLWWLEVPCVGCGSSLFKVKCDNREWVMSEGTNE